MALHTGAALEARQLPTDRTDHPRRSGRQPHRTPLRCRHLRLHHAHHPPRDGVAQIPHAAVGSFYRAARVSKRCRGTCTRPAASSLMRWASPSVPPTRGGAYPLCALPATHTASPERAAGRRWKTGDRSVPSPFLSLAETARDPLRTELAARQYSPYSAASAPNAPLRHSL